MLRKHVYEIHIELNLQSRTRLDIHMTFHIVVKFSSTDQKGVTLQKTIIFTIRVMRIQLQHT